MFVDSFDSVGGKVGKEGSPSTHARTHPRAHTHTHTHSSYHALAPYLRFSRIRKKMQPWVAENGLGMI